MPTLFRSFVNRDQYSFDSFDGRGGRGGAIARLRSVGCRAGAAPELRRGRFNRKGEARMRFAFSVKSGGVLILLFLQSHLAKSQFPPTQSAHSLEVVANSTDCSPKHTISPENGCDHISLSNTITDTSQVWNPLPVSSGKRRLESRLYVRQKKWKTAGYKRQRDVDSLCRESAGKLTFRHRLSITCDGLSSRCQGMRNLHCPPLAWNPLCWL